MLPFNYLIMEGRELFKYRMKTLSVFQSGIFLQITGLQRFQRCQFLVLIQEGKTFQALHSGFERGKQLSAVIDSFDGTSSFWGFSLNTINGSNFCLSNMKKSGGVWYLSLTYHLLLEECSKGACFFQEYPLSLECKKTSQTKIIFLPVVPNSNTLPFSNDFQERSSVLGLFNFFYIFFFTSCKLNCISPSAQTKEELLAATANPSILKWYFI